MNNRESLKRATLNNLEPLFHEVYQICYPTIERLARSATSGATIDCESNDIAQVVFLRFNHALHHGKFPDMTLENWKYDGGMVRIRAWLFSATLLVTHEFYRKQKRQDSIRRRCQCAFDGLDQSARSQLLLLLVDEAHEKCSPMEQSVLSMKIDGYSCREIAETLGRSPATIRGHLTSARNRIRDWLEVSGV